MDAIKKHLLQRLPTNGANRNIWADYLADVKNDLGDRPEEDSVILENQGYLFGDLNIPAEGTMRRYGRIPRRMRRVRRELVPEDPDPDRALYKDVEKAGTRRFVSSVALGILTGAAAGAATGGGKLKMGLLGAGSVGLLTYLLSPAVGATAAAITPKRSLEAQRRAEKGIGWRGWIPGLGSYDKWKRLGASTHFEGVKPTRDDRPDLLG